MKHVVTFDKSLEKPCKIVSVEDGLKIATELFNILNKRGDGIGLAANQIGIDAQVAVVNVCDPLILINPIIKEKWDEIPYYEACLSFPKNNIHTKRFKNIVIHTEQEDSDWYFSGAENPTEGKGSWEHNKKEDDELRLLETVCVQHEIDHLDGITMFDRAMVAQPYQASEKIGRNEKVTITDGKETKELKWKKAQPLVESGDWEMAPA
jgi:peptide deformylase